MNKVTLLKGDCLQKLKELKDNSVDSVVTDPPYGIGFMGKAWDTFDTKNVEKANKDATKSYKKTKDTKQDNPNLKGRKNAPIGGKATFAGTYDLSSKGTLQYQKFCEEWGRECLRVLKPGGHLLSSCSPRMYHRMTVGLEDAGFEIRDQIMWIYGSGFPKSHNIGNKLGKEYEGWGTALKPAHEPIVMARKSFKGTVANNVLEHGTGGINIDGCRVGFVSDEDKKEATEKNQHKKFDSKMGTNEVYGDYSMLEPQNYDAVGRFPANIIFDEEAGKILDEQSGISKSSPNKWEGNNNAPIYGKYEKGIRQSTFSDTGGASRFFYCPKASKKDRNEGLDVVEQKNNRPIGTAFTKDDNLFDQKVNNFHPTVKPTDLMAYLVRLVTPKGGVVLDPFMGSGSTGKGAIREGMDFIGIEREDEYMEIAKSRIQHEEGKHKHREFFNEV